MIEKQALAEVYAALLGTGDSGADFLDTPVEDLKNALLGHFKPEHMEELFQDAFIRGVNYVLFHQKLNNKQLSEDDFFGPHGLITKHIDWDDAMMDW